MREQARHAGPHEVDQISREHPVLDRVAIEEVDLDRSPAHAYDDQPQHQGRVVMHDGGEYLASHGPAFDEPGGPYEHEGEHGVDHKDVDADLAIKMVGVGGALGNEETARRRRVPAAPFRLCSSSSSSGGDTPPASYVCVCMLCGCASCRWCTCFPKRPATVFRRYSVWSWLVRSMGYVSAVATASTPTRDGSAAMLRAAGAPSFVDNPRPGRARGQYRQGNRNGLFDSVSYSASEPSLGSS